MTRQTRYLPKNNFIGMRKPFHSSYFEHRSTMLVPFQQIALTSSELSCLEWPFVVETHCPNGGDST
jgi:hypothetical protein